MSTQDNVQTVKDFFAATGRGDKQALLALCAEDTEWIIPGENWPLADTHRGHAGVAGALQKASKAVEMTSPEAPRIRGTGRPGNRRVFAITVRNGKATKIREYIDTQALARGSQMDASGLA